MSVIVPPATIPADIARLITASLIRPPMDALGVSAASVDIVTLLPALWTLYADKGAAHPRLQYYYVLREGADFLRRRLFDSAADYQTSDQFKESLSQVFANLDSLRESTDHDIALLEKSVKGNYGIAMGQMTTNQPRPVPFGGPDPADSVYVGDPLKRSRIYNP